MHDFIPRDGEFEVGAIGMVLGTTVHAEARYKRALQLIDERVVLARAGAEAVHRVRALDGLPFAHESGYVWILVLVQVVPVG